MQIDGQEFKLYRERESERETETETQRERVESGLGRKAAPNAGWLAGFHGMRLTSSLVL
jgi:hypothetical protein